MEPNNTDVWIVPDEGKELSEIFGLGEYISQALDFNLGDISGFGYSFAASASTSLSSAIVSRLATVPVVHSSKARLCEATWLLSIHVNLFGVASSVLDRLIKLRVKFQSEVWVWTAQKLVLNVDINEWLCGINSRTY